MNVSTLNFGLWCAEKEEEAKKNDRLIHTQNNSAYDDIDLWMSLIEISLDSVDTGIFFKNLFQSPLWISQIAIVIKSSRQLLIYTDNQINNNNHVNKFDNVFNRWVIQSVKEKCS